MSPPAAPACRCGHPHSDHLEAVDMCLNGDCRCQRYIPPGVKVKINRRTGRITNVPASKRRR